MRKYKLTKFTIITSCYNSSSTLRATFKSLVNQTYENFEWILIDDLSNDNGMTRDLIVEIANSAPFDVKYVFLNENYFSSRSTYEASLLATGDYACILDHDDKILPKTLERVSEILAGNSDNSVIGVCGRCVDEFGRFIGKPFPENSFIANEGIVRFQIGVTEELFQFTKIQCLRDFFCEMKPGYTNGYVWAKLSKNFNYIYVNEIFREYDTGLPTSYSNSKTAPIRFPHAKAESMLAIINSFDGYLSCNIYYSFKLNASLVRHLLNANLPLLKNMPNGLFAKLLFLCSVPLGFLKSRGFI